VNVGRFTGLDPFAGRLSQPITLNKYTYANGDPINGTDPSGLVDTNLTQVNATEAGATNVGAGQAIAGKGAQVLANRTAGKAFETYIENVLRQAFGNAVKAQIRMSGKGGARVLDLMVKIKDRLVLIEVKTGIPTGGAALARLVGQIKTASGFAGSVETIVVSQSAWEVAALERIALKLGTEEFGATFIQSEVELVQLVRALLLP